jgi:hypothetical protein
MRKTVPLLTGIVLLTSARAAIAQHQHKHTAAKPDSAFQALQERGKRVMGVDQYTSSHVFESLPDGGRIELQRDVEDSVGVRVIRAHLREVAARFTAGDFSLSQEVHATREMPGAKAMREAAGVIRSVYRDLPRGGEVRLTSSDARAVHAIHAFLEFQRSEHRTGAPTL